MQSRLDKYISENGGLTRTESKKAISGGRVCINGSICKKPETKVEDKDTVTLDNKAINSVGMVYLILNKPASVLSATEDSREKTVLDLLKEKEELSERLGRVELFPVGRLDKDTEGLLLLTNDGLLSHNLLSPKKHVEKEYYAECVGKLNPNAVEMFLEGIMVGEEYKALPAGLKILENKGDSCKLLVTLTEGKFHQVKRMCHEIGVEVTFLKRIRFGRLKLPEDMAIGEFRFINPEDI